MTSSADKNNGDLLDRLVGRREVRRRFPVSDMTIWRWEKGGRFPQHVTIGGLNFWRDSDLRAVERGEYIPPFDGTDSSSAAVAGAA